MDKNSIQNLYEGDASIIIHLFYSQYNLKLPIYVQPPRHKHWVEREKNITKGTVWTCENKNGLWGYESSRVLISCNSYWTQAKRMWSYTATRKSIWGNETLAKSITSVYSVSEDWHVEFELIKESRRTWERWQWRCLCWNAASVKNSLKAAIRWLGCHLVKHPW